MWHWSSDCCAVQKRQRKFQFFFFSLQFCCCWENKNKKQKTHPHPHPKQKASLFSPPCFDIIVMKDMIQKKEKKQKKKLRREYHSTENVASVTNKQKSFKTLPNGSHYWYQVLHSTFALIIKMTQNSNSNSKTLFYKDCSLGSFKKPV